MGMRITARLGTAALAAASLLLITTGCASGSGASGSLSTTQISPPDGEVVGAEVGADGAAEGDPRAYGVSVGALVGLISGLGHALGSKNTI